LPDAAGMGIIRQCIFRTILSKPLFNQYILTPQMKMIVEEEIRERFEALLAMRDRHMGRMLGMEFEYVSREKMVASMPVNENTVQPFGMLHGGASVALAESLASIGAWLNIDDQKKMAAGLEINANHVRPVRDGRVRATAVPLHRGAGTQIWEILIHTTEGKLVCISRCTVAVIPIRKGVERI
jgi:1,4-dihydroxy-2-naphthoyl-CoA hydrolase